MLQGGEAPADPGADGAQDEDRRQVGVSHERAAQQAAALVPAVHAPGHHHHQVVGQREARVLAPPAVESQGHVKSYYSCCFSCWCFNTNVKMLVSLYLIK